MANSTINAVTEEIISQMEAGTQNIQAWGITPVQVYGYAYCQGTVLDCSILAAEGTSSIVLGFVDGTNQTYDQGMVFLDLPSCLAAMQILGEGIPAAIAAWQNPQQATNAAPATPPVPATPDQQPATPATPDQAPPAASPNTGS